MGVGQSAWDSSRYSFNWVELHHTAPLNSSGVSRHGAPGRAPTSSMHRDHLHVASVQPPDAQPAPVGSLADGQDKVVGHFFQGTPVPPHSGHWPPILAVCGASQCQYTIVQSVTRMYFFKQKNMDVFQFF